MPFKLRCPNNHLLLVKDELAGKSLHCPVCHAQIGRQEAPVPLAPEEVLTEFDWALSAEALSATTAKKELEKETPPETPLVPPTPRKEKRHRLRILGYGLILLATAMVLFLVGVPLLYPGLGVWAGLCLLLCSVACEITGMLFCYRVPREVGARGLLVAALGLSLVQVGSFRFVSEGVFAWESELQEMPAKPIWTVPAWQEKEDTQQAARQRTHQQRLFVLLALVLFIWMIHKVLLFRFLYLLADYLEAEGLTHDVNRLLRQAMLLPIGTVSWLLLVPTLVTLPLWLGPLFMIVATLTGVALAGWWVLYVVLYVVLLFRLRGCVRS